MALLIVECRSQRFIKGVGIDNIFQNSDDQTESECRYYL